MADYPQGTDIPNPVNLPTGTGTPHTIENPTQGQPWGSNNFEVPSTNQRGGDRGVLGTGDLGRNYNFGNTYTNLSFQRDPFVHLLTKFKKKPTDDFKFEYAIKRNLATFKRYGYAVGIGGTGSVGDLGQIGTTGTEILVDAGETSWGNDALIDILASGGWNVDEMPEKGKKINVLMMGDYKTHGNITNKIGNTDNNVALGAPLTKPNWFLANQVVRIPTADTAGGAINGYCLVKVLGVSDVRIDSSDSTTKIAEGVNIFGVVVKQESNSTFLFGTTGDSTAASLVNVDPSTGENSIAQYLEPRRSYISGTAYHEMSSYGDTWRQQPFTTDHGQTQIFKKTAMMSGRAMATKLKFGENPWKNEWQDKMTEMTWEIGQAGYFGEQFTDDDGVTYTEGIVNFILNNGNSFTWSSAHTVDDYMEQLSALHDPRFMVGGKQSQVYFCNTEVWNWHAKLGGFMKNNAEVSANYSVQFSGTGKMAGVKYRSFDVDGTTIKLVRDIHLDQTHIKMICANMSACAIRPLIGNGVNRDVTVYPGVKTVKNSGEDYRVDLIQGDIGFEFSAPETHAVWL
jgi:hypothetical protein